MKAGGALRPFRGGHDAAVADDHQGVHPSAGANQRHARQPPVAPQENAEHRVRRHVDGAVSPGAAGRGDHRDHDLGGQRGGGEPGSAEPQLGEPAQAAAGERDAEQAQPGQRDQDHAARPSAGSRPRIVRDSTSQRVAWGPSSGWLMANP